MSAGRRVGKLGLPYRYDSLEELSDGVAAAQSRLAGAVGFGDAAPTETVAVVDSFAPKDEDAVRGELGVVESGYLETDSDETTGHGSIVSQRVQDWGDFDRYDFYQIINEHGQYRDGDLVAALNDARENGADIVNVSAASDHMSMGWKACSPESQPCSVCHAVRDVVESGTTVVAAAGNAAQLDVMGCPALADAAICVGAAVAKCTADLNDELRTLRRPEVESRPPGAYYLTGGHESGVDGTYCSTEGCGPRMTCSENRVIEYSEINVAEVNGKPDVLAPAHVILVREDEAAISEATSWAAPFVTGQLGSLVSGLLDAGVQIVTEDSRDSGETNLHRMLESNGRVVEGCRSKLYDGSRIVASVEANTPVSFERKDPAVDVVTDDRY